MADLVNSTHKERLSPTNSEPSHLKGGSYDVLGGPAWDHQGGPDAFKIDAAKGVGTDTTIPKSVGAEASHLKTEDSDESDELDIDFGDGDGVDVDDLDRSIDEFEETDPVDIDIALDDEDDEEKPVSEETDAADSEAKAKEDAKEDELKEEDDSENPFAKKDDEKDVVKEGELPPWLKKDGDKDDEGEEKKEVEEELGAQPTELDAAKDEKPIDEAVKIRIKLPDAKLFESVNMSAKTQKKVGIVFESAIRQTTKQVAAQLHAHYKKLFEQRLEARDRVLQKQMDSYLTYVTEEWVKANQVAIRKSLRTQLAEEFMTGLQRLFKEHYIDVPESKVNVVEKLTEDVRKLRKALNVEHANKMKLHKLAEAANKARIVAESAKGLSEASTVKLRQLASETVYTNAKDFRAKVALLKESYFTQAKPELKRLPEDDVQEAAPAARPKASQDADINAVALTLSQQAKASKW